jgi:hypothetical protein
LYLEKRGLNIDSFYIISNEFERQKYLDIERSILSDTYDFILVFEMDHETNLQRNLIKKYPNKFTIVNTKNQCFSKSSFERCLDEGLYKNSL